ncbi:pyridoxal-phosphate dependent enzyme [Streptomyces violaceoruber]
MIAITEIEAAAERIAGHVVRTPTVPSPGLSALLGVPVTAKLELLQRTGSFKARGATAKLLSLTEAERAAGVVAVSGGNHGIAVAVMAAALDVKATVVMPRTAPARSVEIAEEAGALVRLTDGMDSAFALVTRLREEGLTLVHPFDDPAWIHPPPDLPRALICTRHQQASSDSRHRTPLDIRALTELTHARSTAHRPPTTASLSWATTITTRWYDHHQHLHQRWRTRLTQLTATNSPGAKAHYRRRRDSHGDWHAAAQRNHFNRMIGQLYHCLQHGHHFDEAVAFPTSGPAVAQVA